MVCDNTGRTLFMKKKFAYLPTQMDSGKWVFLKTFMSQEYYLWHYEGHGNVVHNYTHEEWVLKKLTS